MVTVRAFEPADAAAVVGLRREWGLERGQAEVEGYDAAARAWPLRRHLVYPAGLLVQIDETAALRAPCWR